MEKKKRTSKFSDTAFFKKAARLKRANLQEFLINEGHRLTRKQIREAANPENYKSHEIRHYKKGLVLKTELVETICQFWSDRVPKALLLEWSETHVEILLQHAQDSLTPACWKKIKETDPRELLGYRPDKLSPQQIAQYTFRKKHLLTDILTKKPPAYPEGTREHLLSAIGRSLEKNLEISPEILRVWTQETTRQL